MYRLLIIQFLRSRMALVALFLLLILGLASIAMGKQFLEKQKHEQAQTAAQQAQHLKRLVKYHGSEMGLLLYYMRFAYINPSAPLTALSVGQRDVNSSIQSVTIRALEGQRYDTDIRNPYELMAGRFDLSFVLLYLFPLAIIALGFNLYSEENEQGTWPIVRAQTSSRRRYLLLKISVPFLCVNAVLILLFLAAALWLQMPMNAAFAGFVTNNVLYIWLWFAIVLAIVSLYKNSSFNALALLSIWLLLTLLLPAAANNYITASYPVPESLSTMLNQRDGYHKKWDVSKEQSLQPFFASYPQYKGLSWTAPGFDWLWYYAMQHCGDAEAKPSSLALRNKLMQREKSSQRFAWFVPSLHTQLLNNDLAQSGLKNQLAFLDSTAAFHEQLRLGFYPKIFANLPASSENFDGYKPVTARLTPEPALPGSLYNGLFFIAIAGLAVYRIKP